MLEVCSHTGRDSKMREIDQVRSTKRLSFRRKPDGCFKRSGALESVPLSKPMREPKLAATR